LIGNDFIPHLPHLHINNGALSKLFDVYKEELPKLEGKRLVCKYSLFDFKRHFESKVTSIIVAL
jgi:hypothetical protein